MVSQSPAASTTTATRDLARAAVDSSILLISGWCWPDSRQGVKTSTDQMVDAEWWSAQPPEHAAEGSPQGNRPLAWHARRPAPRGRPGWAQAPARRGSA